MGLGASSLPDKAELVRRAPLILFPVCSLKGHSFDTSDVACRLLRQVPPNPAPLSIPDALCAERPKLSTRPGRGGADSASKERAALSGSVGCRLPREVPSPTLILHTLEDPGAIGAAGVGAGRVRTVTGEWREAGSSGPRRSTLSICARRTEDLLTVFVSVRPESSKMPRLLMGKKELHH